MRGLVERHPQLDGFWARLNLAAGRQRAESLAWSAGFDVGHGRDHRTPGSVDERAGQQAPLCLTLDEADAGSRLRLASAGRQWITLHDGFDTSAHVRPGQAVKCWPLEHWAELVSKLKALHPSLRIVQIGGASSRPIAGVDDCLIGRSGSAKPCGCYRARHCTSTANPDWCTPRMRWARLRWSCSAPPMSASLATATTST
ncbi:MAG: hypothetical protein V5B44_06780 [Candidatus Accumulibacter necessarius]